MSMQNMFSCRNKENNKTITKTYLYIILTHFNAAPPPFIIVKLEFTGIYIIFLISAQKHRLWVLYRIGEAVLTGTAI